MWFILNSGLTMIYQSLDGWTKWSIYQWATVHCHCLISGTLWETSRQWLTRSLLCRLVRHISIFVIAPDHSLSRVERSKQPKSGPEPRAWISRKTTALNPVTCYTKKAPGPFLGEALGKVLLGRKVTNESRKKQRLKKSTYGCIICDIILVREGSCFASQVNSPQNVSKASIMRAYHRVPCAQTHFRP